MASSWPAPAQQAVSLHATELDAQPQPDGPADMGQPPQPSSGFQSAASQALYSGGYDPAASQSMFSQQPAPAMQPSLGAPYENMAAQGLPECAHAFYESLSSQAQQQPVTQGTYSLHQVQQAQQQLLAPFEGMSLQSTSSQGQEVFDSLTGQVQAPYGNLAGQPVQQGMQQGILEGLAHQQRVASYNNLIAQAQAQAHAQAQAQVDHEQRLLDNLAQAGHEQRLMDEYAAAENASRQAAAAGLLNSLHAAAAAGAPPQQPLGLGEKEAAALVRGKPPRETDGEDVGVENLVDLPDLGG